MTAARVVAAGVLLVVLGVAWLLGPWLLIVSGVLLVVAGLLIPEEALSRVHIARPPRR